ncbi:GNAT family N-acetyltransferase [Coleofasciculus sp. FACHB-64]|uniref:GNAT family N-acetyltransferase n=1 Tax=Cyanophyceae TaxID=3028117 RepID=UPI0018F039A8
MSKIAPKEYHSKTGDVVTVRSALIEDAKALVDLQFSVAQEGKYMVTEAEEFNLTKSEEKETIEQHSQQPGQLYLVAEIDNTVVGFVEFENGNRRRTSHSGILSIFVDREWRGKGIGSFLLQELIDWAANEPLIEKVTLAVFSTNRSAIALYKKFGFEEEGRCPKDMKLAIGKYIDSVLMYKFVKKM